MCTDGTRLLAKRLFDLAETVFAYNHGREQMKHLVRLILIYFVVILRFLVSEGASAEQNTRPTCKSVPLPSWTDQEEWVWERLCEGEVADLSRLDDSTPQANRAESWNERRNISPEFLSTILTDGTYQGLLRDKTVRIKGARFIDGIDLSNTEIGCDIILENIRIDETAKLDNLKLDGHLRFRNVWAPLVNLINAKVRGEVDLHGTFDNLNLSKARIDGQLSLRTSTINEYLFMNWTNLAQNLDMSEGNFGTVMLMHGNIRSIFLSDHATYRENVMIDSVNFGANVWTRRSIFEGSVILVYSDIGKNLDISGSSFFSSLDLTGTRIEGEFRFAMGQETADNVAKWEDGTFLNLRNAFAQALHDRASPKAWAETLELEGFDYAQVGGFLSEGATTLVDRDVGWLRDWLARDKTFSPQPYKQLASVLRAAGYPDKADTILIEMMNRQRDSADIGLRTRLWLWVKWALVGYGYDSWRAIFWFLALTFVGMFMFKRSLLGRVARRSTLFWYSLDMALPIIDLNRAHSKVRLKGGVLVYFYCHKILGFVFVSFLIAGLSGLTK